MQLAEKFLVIIEQKLDAYFRTQEGASIDLANWLSEEFSRENLTALLMHLIKSPQLLDTISRNSYLHGNGFLKVVLLNKSYKLRLHVWHKGQSCEENIHDHRWSFASCVLTGTLRSEIWRDAIAGEEKAQRFSEYQYHATTKNNAAFLKEKGNCLLVRSEHMDVSAGQFYVMPEQRLHCINNPGDQMVATIVCTAPTKQGTTRLIKTRDIQPEVTPPRLSSRQLRSELLRFLTLYSQTKSSHKLAV